MNLIRSINLNLSERLERDLKFRKRFFRGQAQDEIAASIVSLRKLRKKRQVDLAEDASMKQSAVSRIEQAEYSAWNLNTLFRIADALDARLRLTFEPAEIVVSHYKEKERQQPDWLVILGDESALEPNYQKVPQLQEASSRFTDAPAAATTG